eukprot:12657810-Ditylum_brightwellii.AAC.1
MISINGRGFKSLNETLVCRFGTDLTVLAEIINDTILECRSPPHQSIVARSRPVCLGHDCFKVSLALDLERSKYDGISKISHENSSDILDIDMSFLYYEDEVIEAVYPKIGVDYGNTMVCIEGSGFKKTVWLSCKVGVAAPMKAIFK